MKSTIEQLSYAERQALVLFYDTEAYKALKKLVEIERTALAQDSVFLDGTIEEIALQSRFLAGGSLKLKGLIKSLGEIYKESEKNNKKS